MTWPVLFSRAHRGEPLGPVVDDARDARDRLDVVDHGGAGVETGDGRERRAQPGLAAAALERVEQSRLLAADVGARAGVDGDVEVVPGVEDVLADEAGGVRLLDGLLHAADDVQDLAAHVDERVPGLDRERTDDDAFDQQVRVGQHERDVLAGAGLGLVGVHHEVAGLLPERRQEAPLHARREARAAAAAQAGVLDLVDDLGRAHGDGLRQRVVSPGLPVRTDRPGTVVAPVGGEHRGEGVGHEDSSEVVGLSSCVAVSSAVASERMSG